MNKDIFERCGTTCEDVSCLVHHLARQVVTEQGTWMIIDELESQAMLESIELLQKYEPERQIKATTYLYTHILGRIKRLSRQYQAYAQARRALEPDASQTEDTVDSPTIEPNPYRMQPDVYYDANQRIRAVKKINIKNAKDVQQYLNTYSHGNSVAARQMAHRRRLSCIIRMRETANRVLTGATQSGASGIISKSQIEAISEGML